ncbi:AfsR/SARP family transcriptional regulator [Mycobacteroides salmoniphilum]|uniref:Regulatory protein AfsR n=1 Tax=Mycobacteroides salmoniphilum TaxID=404941 RepID=A0A4R8SGJ2_9MYCO|nr:AfsR/SARP family transcriptional regulator [Mycobacteroides salmoniphilum]TDZ96033.1 Regulatory protein AfsR [Mycobacteroides salmoniphilum]TEA05130.1 Regulatory protein AfsR [Mycobacteroides salmoniphilum]
MRVSVSVLGPLTVTVHYPNGPITVPITAAKHRSLLAALVTGPGRSASFTAIAEHLWGDHPPQNARSAIHVHVARLRRVLDTTAPGAGSAIVSTTHGYRLDVDEGDVDLGQVSALVARADSARRQSDVREENEYLTAALALWRGTPFQDVESDAIARAEAIRYDDYRTALVERAFGVALDLGGHAGVIGELRAELRAHPLRERLAEQLMLASYRCGRQAEALEVYQELVARLSEDLGIDPGDRIQQLFAQILAQDPALGVVKARDQGHPQHDSASDAHCTLPRTRARLFGCDDELAALAGYLAVDRPALTVISGPPGSGKTALAVSAALASAERFTDGQWFVQARAGGLTRELLVHAGVGAEEVPDEVSARCALVRRILARRRVVLVVDDVTEIHEVASLLPGSGNSAVILTSRSALPALSAGHEVNVVRLGALTPQAANELLAEALSSFEATPGAGELDEIAELCAHNPAALHAVAAGIRGRPARHRAAAVAELRDGRIPNVGELELERLSEAGREIVHAMGLVAGGHFVRESVAALTGLTAAETARSLDELAHSHVVTEFDDGTVALPRGLATQLAARPRAAGYEHALDRLAGWYLEGPDYPSRSFSLRHRLTILALVHPASGLSARRRLALSVFALGKFDIGGGDPDVHAVAAHGASAARELGDHIQFGRFADLTRQLRRTSAAGPLWLPHQDSAAARTAADREALEGHLQRALNLAEEVECSDRVANLFAYQSDNLARIGHALVGLNRLDEASAVQHRALRVAKDNHNPYALATAHLNLSTVLLLEEEFATSRQHATAAVGMFHSLDEPAGEARASVALGDVLRATRLLKESEAQHKHALDIASDLSDVRIEVEAMIGLALTYRYLNEPKQALAHGAESTQRASEAGLRVLEGRALGVHAVNHLFAGSPRRSRTLIRAAVEIHDDTGHELERQCALRWMSIAESGAHRE